MVKSSETFKNRVTEMLGVELPIVQAPMGWIARSQLASAVSNAGGMGIIETSSGELDVIKEEIKKMADLTDKPFGVNIAQAFVRDPNIAQFVIDQGVKFVTTSAGSPTRYTAQLKAAGLTDNIFVYLRRGAGAYICGEESAMIESIEGKRGLPRHRPPYVAQVGIFDRPTLVNNVETLYWVRDIVERGADWFAGQGRNGGKGFRSYSVSGRVKEPGVKLAPAGITARQLIDEFCGGMAEGHALKGYLPGGASGGILPDSMADLPLEFGHLEKHGSFVGSHAVVILSDQDDMKAAALNLMKFFEDESCGQCTPCRNGTEKAVQLMSKSNWDPELLGELAEVMGQASICGLGQAAPNPLLSVLKHFPEEL